MNLRGQHLTQWEGRGTRLWRLLLLATPIPSPWERPSLGTASGALDATPGLWSSVAPGMGKRGVPRLLSPAVPLLRLEGIFGLIMNSGKNPLMSEERPAHYRLILT